MGEHSGSALIGELTGRQVSRCYFVRTGTALFANDESFVVFERADDVVVLADAFGALRARRALIDSLIAERKVFLAAAWTPPTAWRQHFLGVIPRLSIRSGLYPKQQLRKALADWREIMPVKDLGELDVVA
jgi:hypothetical protein